MFHELQRRAVIPALQVAGEAAAPQTVEAALSALRNRLLGQGAYVLPEWTGAKTTAQKCIGIAHKKLAKVGNDLVQMYEPCRKRIVPQVGSGEFGSGFAQQHFKAAGYEALAQEFNTLVVLNLSAVEPRAFAVAWCAQGPRFKGLIIALAMVQRGEGQWSVLSDRPFLVSFKEPEDRASARFEAWLDEQVVVFLSYLERPVTEE